MDSLENLRVLAGSKDFFRVCNTLITSSNLVVASVSFNPSGLKLFLIYTIRADARNGD